MVRLSCPFLVVFAYYLLYVWTSKHPKKVCYTAIVNKKLDDQTQTGAPRAESGMGCEDHIENRTPGHKHLRKQILTAWCGKGDLRSIFDVSHNASLMCLSVKAQIRIVKTTPVKRQRWVHHQWPPGGAKRPAGVIVARASIAVSRVNPYDGLCASVFLTVSTRVLPRSHALA